MVLLFRGSTQAWPYTTWDVWGRAWNTTWSWTWHGCANSPARSTSCKAPSETRLVSISSWTGDLKSSLRRIGWLSLDGKDQNSSIFYHAALMCKPMKYDLYENRDKTCPDWNHKHQFLSVGIQERGVGLSLGAVSELYRETKDCPQERFLLKCKLNQESQFKQTCSLRKQSFRVVTNWLKIVPYWPPIGLQ